jgi:hypothetical protein
MYKNEFLYDTQYAREYDFILWCVRTELVRLSLPLKRIDMLKILTSTTFIGSVLPQKTAGSMVASTQLMLIIQI